VKIQKEPTKVELSESEVNDLKTYISNSNLPEDKKKLIINALQGMIWLSKMLQAKKLSIRKLSRLFGVKTEKNKKNNKDDNDQDNPPSKGPTAQGKGHGRNGKDDYPGAKRVFHNHENLTTGDRCPSCDRGNLYDIEHGSFIRIKGSAPLEATIHIVQKLRCATCGEVFTAETPKEVREQKYDETADVQIALLKYGLGVPFNRLSDLQKYAGVPIPASSQWERVTALADGIWPIHHALIQEAAKGNLQCVDDTPARIIDLKAQLTKEKANRTGIYTTGVVSKNGDRIINLFFTGNKHAGENLDRILEYRPSGLPLVIQMSDALANNNTKIAQTLKCLCLTHGRRNFIDARQDRPKECDYVVSLLGNIYHHDKIAIERRMSDEERLNYHQRKSSRWIKKLRKWCLKCFYLKKIEPNEPLGEAIQYLLNHWKGLTEFLRTPGAPIDNTITERLIKRAILHRKNSLFFKTLLGAYVGDIIMSLIETCKASGKNPFEYLLALHRNRDIVKKDPSNFFPWNYEQNLQLSH